ncbi:hypothetical protein ACFX11_038712 [Malus domestica]
MLITLTRAKFFLWKACSLSKYTMVASGVVSLHMQLVKVHKVTKVAEKMSLFEQYKVERERPLNVKSYCTR